MNDPTTPGRGDDPAADVSAIRADDDLVNQLAAGEHPDPGDPLTDALNAWLERTRRPGGEGRDR